MTRRLGDGGSCVLHRGSGSVGTTRRGKLPGILLSELLLSPSEVSNVTGNIVRITSLPSPINGALSSVAEPGNLQIGGISIPLKIVTIVFRTHPGIASSTTSLYLGSNGYSILHNNGRTVRSGATVFGMVHTTLGGSPLPRSYVRFVASVSRRDTGRLVAVGGCMSILVPHNDTELVNAIIGGSAIPIVRANINGYRVCISGSTSLSVTTSVVFGTGASHPSMYGTTRDLLVRGSITRGTLGLVGGQLSRGGIRLHNSGASGRVLPSVGRTSRSS